MSEERVSEKRFPKSYFAPKPVKVGDEMEVKIEEISKRGDGVTRVQGYVIFVPNVRQGETVKIKISKIRPSFAVAEVIQ